MSSDRREAVTTTETKTPYPERMYEQAVRTHTRRAASALENITKDGASLPSRLENGQEIDASGARQLAEDAIRACEHLSALETLRETREWDEAEKAEPRRVYTRDAEGAIIAVDARDNIPRASR